MKIVVAGVYVDDQDKALNFYTNVLGFVKKTEIPMGEVRWLTVVGEFEALCSLASYAYENPTDPFPELVAEGPCFEGDGLGHRPEQNRHGRLLGRRAPGRIDLHQL